jgi:hypothetical protein
MEGRPVRESDGDNRQALGGADAPPAESAQYQQQAH